MDDLLDLSPLEQELEALTAIYLDELEIHRSEDGQKVEEVELLLHPATGNDTTKQFVRMNLAFRPGCQYPDEIPEIIIRNPRGLGEEEMVSLVEDMREKATECVGEVMLYTLIEMAKESLTEGNMPHCPCVVCLEHFQEHDLFHRTACYHYFHNRCLHKYLEHSRQQIQQDMMDAREQRHLNPEDEIEEVRIVCPVCRNPMDEDSLAVFCSDTEEEEVEHFVIPPNIREQQQKMAELYEIQKSKGAIIDVEWERNKFLVNPEEKVRVPVKATCDDTSEEKSSKEKESEEACKNEIGNKSQVRDKKQGDTSRKWGSSSDHDNRPRHQYSQRHFNEKYDDRRRDNYYSHNERKGGRMDFRDKNGTYSKSGSARRRDDTYHNDNRFRKDSRLEKAHDNVGSSSSRECLSSNEGLTCSGVSEEVGGISFVNSRPKRSGDSEQGVGQREGGFSESRGRGARSEGGEREPHWRQGRGRGSREGTRTTDGDSYTRGARGHCNNLDSRSLEGRGGPSHRGSGRLSSSAYSNDGDRDRRKDDSYEDDNFPSRYGGNPQNRRGGRGGGVGRGERRNERGGGSARGRGGFRRDDERGNGEIDKSSCKSEDGVTASSSNNDGIGRGLENRNDGFTSRSNNYSEKKRNEYDDGDERQQRHREHRDHDQHRNPTGRGGRRGNEFYRNDRDDRRGRGYGDSGRGGRGGGGNRSDQRGGGRGGRANGGPRDEEDDEDGQRREMDLKNFEINQRWRELNFGRQAGEQGQHLDKGKGGGFGVIDDDDDDVKCAHNNNNNDLSGDDGVRHNPNYNEKVYTVASSDSEEDWGKESDPYTFERSKIRREQFGEYGKHKAEQLAYYAQKVDKRAEKQNSMRAEQRRIQREQHLKGQRDQRARLEQQDAQSTVPSQSLSVLDRFKLEQEKKDKKEESSPHDKGYEKDKSVQRVNGAEAAESSSLHNDVDDDDESSSSEEICKDADFYRSKAGPLPNKNKVEGIEWVGVRDHDDYGDSSLVESVTSNANDSNAFEDSWRRREEKRRQRQKQPRMKGKMNKDNAEKKEKDVEVGDELSKNSLNGETRVRSRRRDRGKEYQGVRKNFVAIGENDVCDIVNKQSIVSSNGLTKVSFGDGNNASPSRDSCDLASNLQRKTKPVKPLDLRKKTHASVSNESRRSQTTDHVGIENLVEKIPSLLQDTYNESTADSGKRTVPKKDCTNGAKGDMRSYGLSNSTELDSKLTVPNSKTVISKSKPKPLDFRKGSKKGI